MEIQTGLILEEEIKFIAGRQIKTRKLKALDGYCFYSKKDKEEIDKWQPTEETDTKPTLNYMKQAFLGLNDSPENYVSVPIQINFEIV